MKYIIKKNKKQRSLFNQFEKKKLILKTISKNFLFSKEIRWKNQQKFFLINNNSSITRIKNRCIVTGRSKSIYRFFKLSRIQLREFASQGLLPGLSKYNW